MNQPIRIGILGAANIAERLVAPAICSDKKFKLVAIASRSKEKAKRFASRFNCNLVVGYKNLIERDDIDALYIPLPIGLHHEWVIKGLENGKHILCEKSLAMDYESTRILIDAARKASRVLMENFMFIYHSQHQFILDRLRSGEIGSIRCFRSSFGFPPFKKDNIRYKKDLGGGALLDAGTYTVRAAQLILGNELEVKASFLNDHPKNHVDIFGGAFLVSKSGCFAELAFGFDNFYQCNYEIWGSKGKLISHRAFTAGPGISPMVTIEKQDEKLEMYLPQDHHFLNILSHFYNSIMNGDLESNFSQLLNQSRLLTQIRENAVL